MSRIRWTALFAVLMLIIAACGGDDDDTGGGTDTSAAAGSDGDLAGTELALWGWSSSDAENAALTDLVGQFNTETGAVAEFQAQADYDTALQAALAGGEPPDVFYVDAGRLPDLADAGVLASVPDGSLTEPDGIFPSLRDAFTVDDTWYCPPKDFSTLALVYDPAALEAAGVAVPTTWEELAAAATALTTDTQAGLALAPEYFRWGVFFFQAGAAIANDDVSEVTMDSDGAREALEFLSGLYASGAAVTPASVDSGWAGEAFGQAKAAMTIEGNWIVNAMTDTFPDREYAVAELPTGPAGQGTFAFTVCYGVPVNAANPDASWALVDYLTNPEGSLAWTSAFTVMPAHESVTDEWVADHPELAAFVAGAEYATDNKFVPGFSDVIGVFNDNAQGLVDGSVSVDQLIEEVESAGADVLGG